MLKQKQIENKSIISNIQKTAAKNPEIQSLVGTCSPGQPNETQYYVSPKYGGPETSMTVKEAECTSDSESD